MRAFTIALPQIPESMISAQRCIDSGKRFGIDVELFEGVFRDVADDIRKQEGVKIAGGKIDETYSNAGGVIGCFMSHFLLWKKCRELVEPILILEHDAIINAPIPVLDYNYAINLGQPSYGRHAEPKQPGIYPLFSKKHLPGTHAYICTPRSAKDFTKYAMKKGMSAADCYLSKDKFNDLAEYYPWPVHVEDTFSTVQKEKGISTKHLYNNREGYRLI